MEGLPAGQFATTTVNVQAGVATYFKESTRLESRPQPLAFVQPLLLNVQVVSPVTIARLD